MTRLSPRVVGWTIFVSSIVFVATPLRTIYNVKLETNVSLSDAAYAVRLARRPTANKRAVFEKAVEIAEAIKAAKHDKELTSKQIIWAAQLAKNSNPAGEVVTKEVSAMANSIRRALDNDSPQAATARNIKFEVLKNHLAIVSISPPMEKVSIQCNVSGTGGYFVPHYGQTDAHGTVTFPLECIRNNTDKIWAAVVLNGNSISTTYK